MSARLTHTKLYLLQVDMDQSDPFSMSNYGVYHCQWYLRKHEDCKKYTTMACRFWPEIRAKNQGGTLGKMLLVRPSKAQDLLQKNQTYVWYQDDISLDEHRLVVTFQFGKTGRK